MHETAIAQSLLEIILKEANEQGRPVRAKISCGQLNALNDDVLTFAFEALSKGTACEGIALRIEHKPIECRCQNCGNVYIAELSDVKCPQCDSEAFQLLPDAPLVLEEIEFGNEEGMNDG